ncbi:MAG: hypothetical protein U0U46_15620 [Saprospiraceae bacterium]|nr:hypothetical protein [Saprospiraceae bacterium]
MSTVPLTKESLAQVYIDGLEDKLKEAENKLREMNAYYQSALNAYNEAKTWEDKITIYWVNIMRTEDLADTVVADLEKLTNQIECVCFNADQYTQAVRVLICCVKDVGLVLEYTTTEMRDLMARIDCVKSKEPALDASKSILKCLDDYRTKLDAALKQTLETLKLALGLLKTAQLVLNEKRGLDDFIAYLWVNGGGRQVAENEPPLAEVDDDCFYEPDDSEPTAGSCPPIQYNKPCQPPSDCKGVTLEIEQRTYYINTSEQYGSARETRQTVEEQLHQAQQVRDGAQAKRDSVFKALADAKKAKECN